jgi:hypothetical protein
VVFGEAKPKDKPHVPLESKDLWPGRVVLYMGKPVKVVAVSMSVAPSGAQIVLAVVRRQQGDEQTVFAGQLAEQ